MSNTNIQPLITLIPGAPMMPSSRPTLPQEQTCYEPVTGTDRLLLAMLHSLQRVEAAHGAADLAVESLRSEVMLLAGEIAKLRSDLAAIKNPAPAPAVTPNPALTIPPRVPGKPLRGR